MLGPRSGAGVKGGAAAERSEGTLDAGEHRGLLGGRWSTVLEALRSESFQVYLARASAYSMRNPLDEPVRLKSPSRRRAQISARIMVPERR
ncbi:MAG: hypothetical protein E2P02_00505 [Acidobacteria bacterium]|nr:MAG: hypothetical protein E2P02_00505 [Acidobacteriota bacterium]